MIVNLIGTICAKYHNLSSIECFISSLVVSLIASILDKYVYRGSLCLYGQLFGGVVWLLPGITITIALLELYSKMIVYGSSRLVYGVSLCSQVGFGLALGYKLIFTKQDIPDSFVNGCRDPVNDAFGFILLPIVSLGLGIIIQAELYQIPGMILCAGCGQFTSYLLNYKTLKLASDIVPLVSAFVVTVTARIYSSVKKRRSLVYIIAGLLVLVPGGVGVKGMSKIWSEDSENTDTAMEFTFEMIMIGVCLAIGVFVALMPRRNWLIVKRKRAIKTTTAGGILSVPTFLNQHNIFSSIPIVQETSHCSESLLSNNGVRSELEEGNSSHKKYADV